MSKKILSNLTLFVFLWGILLNNFTFATLGGWANTNQKSNSLSSISYPTGNQFTKIKSLIDEYLILDDKSYGISKYKASLKYNEVIEKQLKVLVIENFTGNEVFFNDLFQNKNYYNYDKNKDQTSILGLKTILDAIPSSKSKYTILQNIFKDDSITSNLLSTSFGINFDGEFDNRLIESIKFEIDNYKKNYSRLPSTNELYKITLFSNYKSEEIGKQSGNFEYIVNPIADDKKIENDIQKTIKFLNNLDNSQIPSLQEDIQTIKNEYKNYDKIIEVYNKYPDNTDMLNGLLQDYEYKLLEKNNLYTLSGAYENIYALTGLNNQNQAKDYSKALGNKEVKNIPEIYKKIPQNSIFFDIKDPSFIFEQLEEKDSFLDKATGKSSIKVLKSYIMQWLDIKDFENLKNNLKNEFLIVINNLDLTAPNIVLIINEKDKGILVPGKKPKAAITKDGLIYIANTKKLLEDFTSTDEKNSIYFSDDFRYLWSKKQYSNDSIFIFAGDGFFQKMTSLENYVKMIRKSKDYLNLVNLQTLTWAYSDLKGQKIDNFDQIKPLFESIGLKTESLTGYQIKNNIITNNQIGKVDDSINIDEIDYDLNKITSNEIESYKSDILGYKEIWRNGFDPLGISISRLGDGFDIDFFMSPLPNILDGELNLFKSIFEDIGIKDIGFLTNDKLRIGGLGMMFGFDVNKLKDKIQQNTQSRELEEIKDGLKSLSEETLNGKDPLDYLGGEILLGIGGLDKDVFEGRNTEKIDAFIGIKFVSQDKGKEFLEMIKNAIIKQEDSLKKFIMNPLISDYKNNKIYKMPVKDFFEITICYTYIDEYLYIGLNENAIKKVIDNTQSPNQIKNNFIKNVKFDGNKSVLFYFIKDELKDSIKSLIDAGKTDLLKFTPYFEVQDSDLNPINIYISNFYNNSYFAKLLGEDKPIVDINFGIINIKSDDDKLLLKIDKGSIKIKNNVIKKDFEDMLTKLDKGYFEGNGKDIIELLKDEKKWNEIVTINTINNFSDSNEIENLIKNLLFGFNIGDNEININIKTYGKITENKGIQKELKQIKDKFIGKDGLNYQVIFLIIGLLVILISLGIYILKNPKK